MSTVAPGTAIVTGASRGIGRAIAVRLAADGYAVVVNYARNAAEAEKVVGEVCDAGGKAIAVGADVSSPGDVAALYDSAERAFGKVSALVNNAGIMITASLAEVSLDDFDRMMAINTRGVFLTLREAAQRMADGGRIVNLSTSALALRLPGYGGYVASKAAVEALTGVFAKELRGRQITVNSVAPGPVGTELFLNGKSPEQVEHLAKLNPFERLGTPEDIAGAVSFLLGPDGGWVNGQTVRANGGMA